MRIGIIGAGALGCLFGGLLGHAGHEVTLVHRNGAVTSAIRKNGVRVRYPSGRQVRVRVDAGKAPAKLFQQDLVMFSVKSYSTREAAVMHMGLVGKHVPILTLQNGLGNVETLTRFFKENPILGGTTTEASLLLNPGDVVHTGIGESKIGETTNGPPQRCALIADKFKHAGLKTTVTRNVRGAIWTKVIVNAAINPISALLRVPNGALVRRRDLFPSLREVVEEGVAVSQAEGVRLDPTNPFPLVLKVARATGSNRSSMLRDIERGRMTEVRQLNGALAKIGANHHVRVPLNTLLTSLILMAERSANVYH